MYDFHHHHILRIEAWAIGAGLIKNKEQLYQNERRRKLRCISLTDDYIEEMDYFFVVINVFNWKT